MQIYDKIKWHIEYGENQTEVIKRFSMIMDFLHEKNMLNDVGEEIYQLGVDNDISIHNEMLNYEGTTFMDKYYDRISKIDTEVLKEILK